AVLLGLTPAHAAAFLAAARSDGLRAPVVGGPALFGDPLFEHAAGTGPTYIASTVPAGPVAKRYRQTFESRYGPGARFDAIACQAVLLAVNAIRQADGYDDLTRQTVAAGILDPGRFEGVFDFPISFDSGGGLRGGALWIYRLAGARTDLVGPA
ncbi:MAG: hypothetical protein ACREPA_12680, partial [Candidatus Dormibacteraceae bacterium]